MSGLRRTPGRLHGIGLPTDSLLAPRVGADLNSIKDARPFLKWAGGKRQLLPELTSRLPARFPAQAGRYHEPFVGGGALFFWLAANGKLPKQGARLSDINKELVNAYQVVRDRVETLLTLLGAFVNDEDFYYQVRAQDPAKLDPVQRAARLIYLNKTCFNGLFRENRRGQFNVPYGRYASPQFRCEEDLRAASRALRQAVIVESPFDLILEEAAPGDLVYCDPPYAPVSRTASFTTYSRDGFDEATQKRLCDVVTTLGERGVNVLLSNSAVPFTEELYRDLHREEVYATRAINSRGDRRGKVPELLVAAGPLASELQARRAATASSRSPAPLDIRVA